MFAMMSNPECYTEDGKPGNLKAVESKEIKPAEVKVEKVYSNMSPKDSKVKVNDNYSNPSNGYRNEHTNLISTSAETITKEECVSKNKNK